MDYKLSVPFFSQKDNILKSFYGDNGCGLASLRMIAEYFIGETVGSGGQEGRPDFDIPLPRHTAADRRAIRHDEIAHRREGVFHFAAHEDPLFRDENIFEEQESLSDAALVDGVVEPFFFVAGIARMTGFDYGQTFDVSRNHE